MRDSHSIAEATRIGPVARRLPAGGGTSAQALRAGLVTEYALAYLRGGPLHLLHLLGWLVQGRAALATALTQRVPADAVDAVPRDPEADRDAGSNGACSRLPSWVMPLVECARPHQWAKHVLVLVPAVLSGQVTQLSVTLNVALAFLALCILASSTYMLNDLWDASEDRRHWSKRRRPIASGRLSATTALLAAVLGIACGLGLGFAIGRGVALALCSYLALTLLYSFVLKRVPLMDVSALAGLFTLRLVLGIAAAGVFASPWLLVFSMLLFSSLCFTKRYIELLRSVQRGDAALAHRGYRAEDSMLMLVLGLATAVASVVVLVLYIIFDAYQQTFYGDTVWLWAFPIILFLWTSRVWLSAVRGELHDDPVAFALQDPSSLMLGSAMLGAFLLAWSGAFA